MTNIPQPGTTLGGKYLVEQVLGVGGMGVVVAATHLQLDQKVAIKFLLPEALANPEVVARFSREARAAAKIRGEHVARVIDVGAFDDGTPFMVMEYLEGHDLAKQLELHGPLLVEDLARYILESCQALAEAHAAKIVHRDLKPSNLFLAQRPDKRAIIKVLDFGISKLEDKPTAGLTKTSALMGTAFYMSPEQLTSPKTVDHRSDIWALGVIMYELLTGRQPFAGESVPEIIASILQNQREPITSLRPDVPPDLVAAVERCLQFKAQDRFSSVGELAGALAPFATEESRRSVAIIGRVLGENVSVSPGAPLPAAGSAVVRPPSATSLPSAIGATQHVGQVGSGAFAAAAVAETKASAQSPGAVTTHGLSTSVAGLPAPTKKPVLAFAGVAVALVAVVAVAFSMRAKDAPASSSSAGMVSPPTEKASPLPPQAAPNAPEAPAAAAAKPALPGLSALEAEPSPGASGGAAAAAAPAAPAPVHASTPKAKTPAGPTKPEAAAAPKPTVAAPVAAPAPSPAPAPAPAGSSTTQKNRLHMEIK
jgi:serine/threonine-protein kinase